MKLSEHIKYRRNRFLSYFFMDFSLKERSVLWYNMVSNLFFQTRSHEIPMGSFAEEIKTYVISLESRDDRRAHIIAEFAKKNLAFKFFNAINGNCYSKEDSQYISTKSQENLTSGSIGCAISHMKLWEFISKSDPKNLYLICEDDITLSHNFNQRLQCLLYDLPLYFDIIFLGGYNNRARDVKYFIYEGLFKSYNPRRGLYSYLISPNSAKKLLSCAKPIDLLYGGIDTKIGKLTRNGKLEVFQVYPSIVDVDYGFTSNIFNYSERNKKRIDDNQQLTASHKT